MQPEDPLQQPWQERLLIFVILCAMVLFLARTLTQFRSQGLSIRRASSDGDSPASRETSEEYQEDHSE